MAEFALIIPILLMLVVAVVDAGRFMLALTALSNAVRDGARVAVTAYPSAEWGDQAAARAQLSAPILDPADLRITVAEVTETAGTFVTVTGEYRWRPVAPLVTLAFGEVPLRSTSRMLAQPAAPPEAPPPTAVEEPSSTAEDAEDEDGEIEATPAPAPDGPAEEQPSQLE
jgi:Flp pilus assembly protein TadG